VYVLTPALATVPGATGTNPTPKHPDGWAWGAENKRQHGHGRSPRVRTTAATSPPPTPNRAEPSIAEQPPLRGAHRRRSESAARSYPDSRSTIHSQWPEPAPWNRCARKQQRCRSGRRLELRPYRTPRHRASPRPRATSSRCWRRHRSSSNSTREPPGPATSLPLGAPRWRHWPYMPCSSQMRRVRYQ